MGAARAGAQTGQEDATMPHLHCHLPTQVSQSASELEAHWSTVALGSTTALQGDASIKRRMLDGAQGGVGQGVTLLQSGLSNASAGHGVPIKFGVFMDIPE